MKIKITQERLKELLHYNPEDGLFTWKVARGCRPAGSYAGLYKHTGYCVIRADDILYQAHRLAWLYVHGRWPAKHIDHIDCNPSNNRLINLREATDSQNHANKRPMNPESGFKGVRADNNKWMARIKINKKTVYLGSFNTREEAHAAYFEAAQRVFGEFARAA